MKTRTNRRAVALIAGTVVLAAGLVGIGASLGLWGPGAQGSRTSTLSGGSAPAMGWRGPTFGVNGHGMMGGGFGNGVGYATASYAISPSSARRLGDAVPAGASVDEAAHRILFRTADVRLAVLGSPGGQPDQTFRIAGMVNPTIEVPRGATIHVTFVNGDPDMPHNFVVTRAAPPFGYGAMMQAPVAFPGAATPILAPAATTSWPAAETSFVANATGTFTYLCTVPGHAQQGMYGRLVVSP